MSGKSRKKKPCKNGDSGTNMTQRFHYILISENYMAYRKNYMACS